MSGLLGSLEIARRALRAHQLTLGVIGTNIANVDTPGYSRRRVDLQPSGDIMTRDGAVGYGVDVLGVRRGRDVRLDAMYREHSSGAGKWDAMSQALTEVEAAFPPSDAGGLGESLDKFWSSWNDLANEPDSATARAAVRSQAGSLVETFHRLDAHLASLAADADSQIAAGVDRINQIAARIAQLNESISADETGGHEASGLRDERDVLLEELSGIATVHIEESASGAQTVSLGSEVLVQEGRSRALEVVSGTGEPASVRWQEGGRTPALVGGALEGIVAARDTRLAEYRAALDTLAAGLVTEVNRLHMTGYGLDGDPAGAFFDARQTTAAGIALDDDIVADLDRIAASGGGAPGDGDLAQSIAALRTSRAMSGGTETFDGFYRSLVGRIGLDTNQASAFRDAELNMVDEIDVQRSEASGVSLDEEMTAMLTTQHAYEAMVRVTTAIDSMMEALLQAI